MLKFLLSSSFLFACIFVSAQVTMYVYDLPSQTLVDSIVDVPFDTTLTSAATPFNLGDFNDVTADLDENWPTENVYPNSQYTLKRQAALDYNIQDYPIRTAVSIRSTTNDTVAHHCSGSMISRRHVLTAAHCIYSNSNDSILVDTLLAAPVFDDGQFNDEFNSSAVVKAYFFKGLSQDFAILELDEPLGQATGWLSIGFEEDDDQISESTVYRWGYPGVTMLFVDSAEYNGDTLYYNYGRADIFGINSIGISGSNAISGESGAPLVKLQYGVEYTCLATLTFSINSNSTRIKNWSYHTMLSVIEDDLTLTVDGLSEEGLFTYYPNPVLDQLNFEGLENGVANSVRVYDQAGKLVLSSVFDEDWLSVARLSTGLYTFEIDGEGQTYRGRFVKE